MRINKEKKKKEGKRKRKRLKTTKGLEEGKRLIQNNKRQQLNLLKSKHNLQLLRLKPKILSGSFLMPQIQMLILKKLWNKI